LCEVLSKNIVIPIICCVVWKGSCSGIEIPTDEHTSLEGVHLTAERFKDVFITMEIQMNIRTYSLAKKYLVSH